MALAIGNGELEARTTLLLGLSPEEVAERRSFLGGSDLNIVIAADPERVLRLWREKVGLEPPEDLSDNLAVQMGTWTESFNLLWMERQTGRRITGRQRKVVHPRHPHLRASIDGETEVDGHGVVIDAKHVNAFSFDMEACIAKYQPQLALGMACTGHERAQLSVFIGSNRWEASRLIERDVFYEAAIIAKANEFWSHVQTRTPPIEIEPVEPPTPVVLMRKVNLSSSNSWIAAEQDYLDTEAAAALHEKACKALKGLVEPDVGEVTGRQLRAKRDKRGALRFSKVRANGSW